MLSSPRPSTLVIIVAGVNVALATTLSAICSLKGRPDMVIPVCTMVTGVYGVATGVQNFLARRSDKRDEKGASDE